MEFLDDAVPLGPRYFVDIVLPGGANEVWERYRKSVRAFRQGTDDLPKRTHDVLFRDYVSSEAIKAFGRWGG